MKKHPILYLEGFKRQFDETLFFLQSINKNNKYAYFFWSGIAMFMSSFFFLYLGFINDSILLQIVYFIACIFLFLFAMQFIIVSYSEKFTELDTVKRNTLVENVIIGENIIIEKENVFDDELIERLFVILEKYKIYTKGSDRFGLYDPEPKGTTQIMVFLNLLKQKKLFKDANQNKIVKIFEKHFEGFNLTNQRFSQIKDSIFEFETKGKKKIIKGLDEESKYINLYNDFFKILDAEHL